MHTKIRIKRLPTWVDNKDKKADGPSLDEIIRTKLHEIRQNLDRFRDENGHLHFHDESVQEIQTFLESISDASFRAIPANAGPVFLLNRVSMFQIAKKKKNDVNEQNSTNDKVPRQRRGGMKRKREKEEEETLHDNEYCINPCKRRRC